jgi:hypothetical protein
MTDLDTATPTTAQPAGREQWLTRETAGIGVARRLSHGLHQARFGSVVAHLESAHTGTAGAGANMFVRQPMQDAP